MNWGFVEKDVEAHFGVKVKNIKKLGGNDDKFNFLLSSATDNIRYIYKAKFSKPDQQTDQLMSELLICLARNKLIVPQSIPKLRNCSEDQLGICKYIKKENLSEHFNDELLTYVEGKILGNEIFKEPDFINLSYNFGRYAALFHNHAKEIKNEEFGLKANSVWFTQNSLQIRAKTHLVEDPLERKVVDYVLEDFEENVISNLHKLERGIIHGDLTDLNVLLISSTTAISNDITDEMCLQSFGAFDFEDSHFGYFVFEMTVAMAYVITKAAREGHVNPWKYGGRFMRGYMSRHDLSESELAVVVTSVAVRFVVSVVMSNDCQEELIKDNDIFYFHSKTMSYLLKLYYEEGKERIADIIMNS